LQHNKHGTALTAGTINKHLKEQDYGFSVATIKRHLRLLGFYYGKGERRNILHESPQVVDYRSVYLGRRLPAKLYDFITKYKGKVPFACVEIVKEFGHEILYTPPYHCELQLIETVWGIGKNRVATQSRADDTGPMVRDRLLNEFARIRSADLVSVWKKSVQNCQDYFEREGTQELPIGIGDEEYESDESALGNEFDDLEGDF
jgi:transposase